MSVLNQTFPSASMEQAQIFSCHYCGIKKPIDQFKIREKDDKYGRKGKPTSRCSRCVTISCNRCQSTKRKRDEEGPDPSEHPVEPSATVSIAQFTEELQKCAPRGDICYSARISTQGLDGDEDEICKVIVGCVWEATGFRFTYDWFPLEVQWLTFPIIPLDTKRNTYRRMVLSNESTNAAKVKPAVTVA